MKKMDLIRLTNVKKTYKTGVTAIQDLNLSIEKGDFVFIIGSTGCGKSTLIKMLYREEKPTAGQIVVGGIDVGKLRNGKVYKIRRKVLKALEDVGLKNKVHNYPDQLSGGEQQRVAIARAIVNDPKLLLCDEPTGNLDPKMSMEIMKVLEDINKQRGTTIIMATHDVEIVNKMKKRVVLIEAGRLKRDYEKGTYYNERY